MDQDQLGGFVDIYVNEEFKRDPTGEEILQELCEDRYVTYTPDDSPANNEESFPPPSSSANTINGMDVLWRCTQLHD